MERTPHEDLDAYRHDGHRLRDWLGHRPCHATSDPSLAGDASDLGNASHPGQPIDRHGGYARDAGDPRRSGDAGNAIRELVAQ